MRTQIHERTGTKPWTSGRVVVMLMLPALAGCGDPASIDGSGPPGDRQTVTVRFDGAEGTRAGTTDFSFQGATFAGGTVRTLNIPDLYGSGLFAYEVLEGSPVTVTFDEPIGFLQLFFTQRGEGETSLTAFDAEGVEVGSILADDSSAGASGDREVSLSAPAVRVEVTHTGSGDGWIDNFAFRIGS